MTTRAMTIFTTCDWFLTTPGEELRGNAVVVHHNTNQAEIVAGSETSTADELEYLIEAVREAQAFIRERSRP